MILSMALWLSAWPHFLSTNQLLQALSGELEESALTDDDFCI